MKKCIYDTILDGVEAHCIAEESGYNSAEAAACSYFHSIIECEPNSYEFSDKPQCSMFVDIIDGEWDLFYDYGADYYFAVKEVELNTQED